MIDAKRKKSFWLKSGCIFIVLCLFFVMFDWIVRDSWSRNDTEQTNVTHQALLPQMTASTTIEQRFTFTGDKITQLLVYPDVYEKWDGVLHAEILDANGVWYSEDVPLNTLETLQAAVITPTNDAKPAGTELTLRLTLVGAPEQAHLSFYWGNTIQAGRYQFAATDVDGFSVNGEAIKGHLDMTVRGESIHTEVMTVYAYVCVGLLALYVLLICWLYHCRKNGKKNVVLDTYDTIRRYSFLIQQFVSRDFNTKYRQSILGVLWSFLNPLLTMGVQYLVFSTLFKSNIEYFVVYLLSGIIMFNYFSEACGMGMESITANGYLINKVYVPKFIYPFSRILSSLINLLISLVPLFGAMLISGLPITPALLLMPIPIFCMVLFVYGMSLLLSTSNVFFRDTRFLWSVVSMLWNFLTPIFYPETIIPASLIQLYHINPMYQFIYFVRCLIIDSVTPQPITYLYCALCAFIPLVLGLWVFKKNENRFIMYL